MQTPGKQPTLNPSLGSLNSVEVRATSELQTKSKLNKDRTTLPAVRVRQNQTAMSIKDNFTADPYQFNTPQKLPLRH